MHCCVALRMSRGSIVRVSLQAQRLDWMLARLAPPALTQVVLAFVLTVSLHACAAPPLSLM